MPAALEPGQIYRVSLIVDSKKDPKPAFLFPYLSGRQQRKLLVVYEQIGQTAMASAAGMDALYNLLREYLLGWEYITCPSGEMMEFDLDSLEDVLSLTEAMELVNRLLLQMPSAEEKKS